MIDVGIQVTVALILTYIVPSLCYSDLNELENNVTLTASFLAGMGFKKQILKQDIQNNTWVNDSHLCESCQKGKLKRGKGFRKTIENNYEGFTELFRNK